MCCISSCVLCKQTNTGSHRGAAVEVPKTTPGFGHLGSECGRRVKGRRRRRRRKGPSQLGCTNSRSPLRSLLAIPAGHSPYLLMGVSTRPSTGRGALRMPKSPAGMVPVPALLPFVNRDTQSWAFSSWSSCGTNQCGLGDRAEEWELLEQSLQSGIYWLFVYWLFLLLIDWGFYQNLIFLGSLVSSVQGWFPRSRFEPLRCS